MIRLVRALGSAVIVGAGVKAGGDLYSALRRRFGGEDEAGDASSSPIDEILASDDDDATKEERLKAERARINKELERLRRARGAKKG